MEMQNSKNAEGAKGDAEGRRDIGVVCIWSEEASGNGMHSFKSYSIFVQKNVSL